MDQPTEQRLIRRAKKGEASAFTALIQEHQKGLFGFLLRRCGQPELCEDVVQEAFVRVLKNIDRFIFYTYCRRRTYEEMVDVTYRL